MTARGLLVLVLVLVTFAGACASEPQGSGVTGSAADVTTLPGDHGSYRVLIPCGQPWAAVGITGTGSVAITDVSAIAAAGQDLHAQLADIQSIWGWGGASLVCEPGVGTQIDLDNWRDVDTVIARVGDWLRQRDLSLQVAIDVSGIPVPDTGR